MYFVISNSDGDISVSAYSKEELEEKFNDEYFGKLPVFVRDLSYININLMGDDNLLIIRGELVVPKAVEVVKRYSLEGN